tara:strand:+ start:7952 stop:8389 length:438 start_codon:yes stop_codon:yes gene_type:complete
MSEDAVDIAKLQVAKHDHANRLQSQSEQIALNQAAIATNSMELAVIQTELSGLKHTVTAGFTDLKDVIVHRGEQDAADRGRQHELAVVAAADRRALWMKALGIVATALTIAGGSGGALWALSDAESERPPVVADAPPGAEYTPSD